MPSSDKKVSMSIVDNREQLPTKKRPAGPDSARGIALVIGALAVSALIMILNETVLSVVLPQLMGDFGVSATTIQWLTTGFMLTMAVVIPTTGFLLQRFTPRTLFTAALLLFIAGTVLATVAPSFAVMLPARVIQACGTAIILPLLMTTTLTSVPVAHRGTVMGLNSVVISVAPAVGPTVSGVIADSLGWRWVFGLMLVVAVLALVLGLFCIRTSGETRKAPLDVFSVLLSVIGFGGLVHGLSSISTLLEGDRMPVLTLVAGLAALAVFVVRQTGLQKTGKALLDLRPFGVHNFRVSLVVVFVCMATMLGTVMVLPLYLQNGLGVGVLTTGLLLLPGGLVQGVLSPLFGRVYDAVGPRPLVIPGAFLLAGGQWWLSMLDGDTGLGTVVAMHVVFCIGMAMLMTPLMTLSLSSLPRDLYGHGSAIVNTLQQLAGAAGTAVLIAAMSIGAAAAAGSGAGSAAAQVLGTQDAFVVGGVLGLVAVVCAPFVRRLRTGD
ncbi:DHA2 family efflux MFS transporter permease subunit [Nocardiopsis algeriensis]|uniref:DHA2 family lincomycin resistance protein-like MFS transporter n=1 Tax=Nocardiopsis algeriensis TaxID=1478215 RepID=A0A841IQ66_9ACTN|nr:DHA2 family efflux MFS transporter permease subunit [Nocardiopsis algeriensis]MBB6120847.1 DHA2 family lincomycin resistance protein-like MFS transporter [Nocardiopsis algeriensis]